MDMKKDDQSVNPPSIWDTIATREAQLLALVEGFAHIVWATDAQGGVLTDPPTHFAHLTWSAFTGLDQSALRDYGWLQSVHPDDLQAFKAVMESAATTHQPIDTQCRLRHRSGEWRWLVIHGAPVRSQGEIIGWMGTGTDITSTKKTEAALRESQERLLAALEACEMSTWIWRFDDNSFWWDAAAVKLWGRVGQEETEHNITALTHHIHAADRDLVAHAMESFALTGQPSRVEFRTVRPDGALQWLASRGRIERDANGKAAYAVGAFIDITQIKAAQESLRAAQKMQSLGTLAGGIAHDFNNILFAMSGNAKLALMEIDAKHSAFTPLNEIIKAGQRAADLVRRILTFAAQRRPSGHYSVIATAIQEALEFSRSTLPANISLTTDFSALPNDATLEVPLDAVELQQVVLNLVSNAVHAIGNQRGSILIKVQVPSPSKVCIIVSDSGCGIDAATAERIFDPFFTTKPIGQGTGLGLSVVHGIASGAGGSINVSSAPGNGSTFTVTLPARQAAGDTSLPTPAPAAPRGGGQHIIYVDDDDSLTMLMTRTLERLGYTVTAFNDPQLAVQTFVDSPQTFDVVVTDLSMPQMSGFDLVAAVKTIRPDIPVVMTSGYVQDKDEALAQKLGVRQIILKPNTVEELAQSLARLCE
jgi:PAS domain S-box-containing protein